MAQAHQLDSGMWRRQVRVKGFPPVSITRRTKKECDLAAVKTEQDMREGKVGRFLSKTLEQAFDRYAKDVSSKKNGEKWELVRFGAFKRQFATLPDFGDVLKGVAFHEIDTHHVVAWRDLRLQSVSEGSVAREVNLLRHVFSTARREWKWTDKNPFEDMDLPRDNAPRTRLPAWREVRHLVRRLGYVTGHAPSTKSQEVAYMFLLALRTGLRASELLRLTDEVVDLKTRVLRVQRKTHYLTRVIREVPFTPAAARLFKPLKGWGGPLFTVKANTRDSLFRRAKEAVGATGLQFRDSRASAATGFAKKGVDVLQLAKILDHGNLELLNSTYYRATAEDIARGLR